jgi:hypothetical protein
MKYEEYLRSPEIQRAYDNMFDEQRKFYRLRSREFGFKEEDAEIYSIKLANVSTDLYFTEIFNYKKKPK